jgi:hypothetical protein
MITSKLLFFVSLALAAIPELYAKPNCPGNIASLPLRLVQHSLIVVPVEINHSGPYDFMVDTGAQVTTVDPALASELHLRTRGTAGVTGVAVYARASETELDLLAAGSHAVEHAVAVVQDLGQLQVADAHIRGILGENFLGHFDLLIDYSRSFLCLDETGLMQSGSRGEHIPLVTARHPELDPPFTEPLLIAVQVNGGSRPMILRLDSGSNAPLLYTESVRESPELAHELVKRSPQLHRVVAGGQQAFAVLPPQDIQVGRSFIRQISFVTPIDTGKDVPKIEEDGLLPTAIFQRIYINRADHYAVVDLW